MNDYATEAAARAHPATNLFPMMGEQELADLVEDIRKHGQQVPIVWHEGLILDGRNRWVACQQLEINPLGRQWQGEADSPTDYVISVNLHRRHLTAAQRAALAVDAEALYAEEARRRQEASRITAERAVSVVEKIPQPSDQDEDESPVNELEYQPDPDAQVWAPPKRDTGKARDKAAKVFNVNPHYVSDAKKLKEEAPAVFEDVKAGKLSIPQARAFVMPEMEKPSEEEKSYYALSRFEAITRLDAATVAAFCHDPDISLPRYEHLAEWLGDFNQSLRDRIARPLRAIK